MYTLDLWRQHQSLPSQLLLQFIDDVDLPLEPLHLPRSESECEEWHNADESHCRGKPWVPPRLLAERFRSGGRRFTANTSSTEEAGVSTEEGGSEGRQHDADQFTARVRIVLRYMIIQVQNTNIYIYQQKRSLWYAGEKGSERY